MLIFSRLRIWFLFFSLGSIVLGLLLLAWHLPPSSDEFESLYASWAIAQHLCPYRDFWQIHTPLFYYFLAPLFSCIQSMEVLHIGRVLTTLLFLANAFLIFFIGKRLFNKRTALVSLFIYFSSWPLLSRMLQIRPDVLVIVCANLSLCMIFSTHVRMSFSFFMAGVCSGLSVASKQCGGVFILGIVIFFIIRLSTAHATLWNNNIFSSKRFNRRSFLYYLMGTIAPLLFFLGFLWKTHSLSAFFQHAVHNDFLKAICFLPVESTHWYPSELLKDYLLINFAHFFFFGMLIILFFRKNIFFKNPGLLLLSILLISSSLLFIISLHPWLQEFLLFSQYLSLLVGFSITWCYKKCRSLFPKLRKTVLPLFTCLCIGSFFISPFYILYQDIKKSPLALPWLIDSSNKILTLTRPHDKCLSLKYACLYRPSIYYYKIASFMTESLTIKKRIETDIIHAILTDNVVVINPFPSYVFGQCTRIKKCIEDHYLLYDNLYIPGKILNVSYGSSLKFFICVEGYYRIQEKEGEGDIYIDGLPLSKKIFFLAKGIHAISLSVNSSRTIMFIYDFESNKKRIV